MWLRFRLNALVCFVLLPSLALGSVIAYSTAMRSVRTEMRAALLVGRQTIEIAIERLRTSAHPGPDLDQLVGSFAGDRHLRVWRTGEERLKTAMTETRVLVLSMHDDPMRCRRARRVGRPRRSPPAARSW
jgi:hypothetical protein